MAFADPYAPLTHSLVHPSNPFASILAEGANAFQQAQALRSARIRGQGQTPTPQVGGMSPLADSVTTAKNLVQSSLIGDDFENLSDEQQSQIKQLKADPNINLQTFEGLLHTVATRHRQDQADQAQQQKASILAKRQAQKEASFTGTPAVPASSMSISQGGENIAGFEHAAQAAGPSPRDKMLDDARSKISPEHYDILKASAQDRNISDAHFQSAIGQAMNAKAVSDRQAESAQNRQQQEQQAAQRRGVQAHIQDLNDKAKQAHDQIGEIEKKYKGLSGGIDMAAQFPGLYKDAAADKQKVDSLKQQRDSLNTRKSQFREGQMYQDPQTGKKYQMTNGEMQEV